MPGKNRHSKRQTFLHNARRAPVGTPAAALSMSAQPRIQLLPRQAQPSSDNAPASTSTTRCSSSNFESSENTHPFAIPSPQGNWTERINGLFSAADMRQPLSRRGTRLIPSHLHTNITNPSEPQPDHPQLSADMIDQGRVLEDSESLRSSNPVSLEDFVKPKKTGKKGKQAARQSQILSEDDPQSQPRSVETEKEEDAGVERFPPLDPKANESTRLQTPAVELSGSPSHEIHSPYPPPAQPTQTQYVRDFRSFQLNEEPTKVASNEEENEFRLIYHPNGDVELFEYYPYTGIANQQWVSCGRVGSEDVSSFTRFYENAYSQHRHDPQSWKLYREHIKATVSQFSRARDNREASQAPTNFNRPTNLNTTRPLLSTVNNPDNIETVDNSYQRYKESLANNYAQNSRHMFFTGNENARNPNTVGNKQFEFGPFDNALDATAVAYLDQKDNSEFDFSFRHPAPATDPGTGHHNYAQGLRAARDHARVREKLRSQQHEGGIKVPQLQTAPAIFERDRFGESQAAHDMSTGAGDQGSEYPVSHFSNPEQANLTGRHFQAQQLSPALLDYLRGARISPEKTIDTVSTSPLEEYKNRMKTRLSYEALLHSSESEEPHASPLHTRSQNKAHRSTTAPRFHKGQEDDEENFSYENTQHLRYHSPPRGIQYSRHLSLDDSEQSGSQSAEETITEFWNSGLVRFKSLCSSAIAMINNPHRHEFDRNRNRRKIDQGGPPQLSGLSESETAPLQLLLQDTFEKYRFSQIVRAGGGGDHWARFTEPPEWNIDRAMRGKESQSLFGEPSWLTAPERVGRDPRYRGMMAGALDNRLGNLGVRRPGPVGPPSKSHQRGRGQTQLYAQGPGFGTHASSHRYDTTRRNVFAARNDPGVIGAPTSGFLNTSPSHHHSFDIGEDGNPRFSCGCAPPPGLPLPSTNAASAGMENGNRPLGQVPRRSEYIPAEYSAGSRLRGLEGVMTEHNALSGDLIGRNGNRHGREMERSGMYRANYAGHGGSFENANGTFEVDRVVGSGRPRRI